MGNIASIIDTHTSAMAGRQYLLDAFRRDFDLNGPSLGD